LSSGFVKALAAVISLVSIPITIGYLGRERYGLWMTVSSAVSMLSFADLGMGSGLLNVLSRAHGTDDVERARRSVSSAFFMLLAIACLVVLALALTHSSVPWARIFNVDTDLGKQESGSVAAVLICCLAAAMPLGVVQRVQLGYQEGFLNDMWQGIGNLLALTGLLTAVWLRCGLPWLVLAVAGAPVLATGLNWVNEFGFRRRWLWPRLEHFHWTTTGVLVRSGLLFFVLQVEYLLTYSSDNIIVAHLFGSKTVAQYAVTQKVFGVLYLIQGCWLIPLWAAYGEAIARRDTAWVRHTLMRSMIGSAVWSSAASVLILVFGHIWFASWLGGRVAAEFALMLAFAVWTVLQCVGATVAIYWNGINMLGFQAVTGLVVMLLAPILRVALGRYFGLPGVVWGVSLAYIIGIAIPTTVYLPRVLRSNDGRR
jgi:O-antigen/teichoic acid export membrane protein